MSEGLRYPRPAILGQIPVDRHSVIEASAGTGKTYTIEHLVVDRLLGTDASLEEILVVTFTEKATSELRKRIRTLIGAVLEGGLAGKEVPEGLDAWTVDAAARAKLEDSLFGFDRAPIYTIHGFCNRMLSDMAFECGQLFEQELVDSKRAFRQAFRDALREDYLREEALKGHMARWYDEGRDEYALRRLLEAAWSQRYLESGLGRPETLPGLLSALAEGFDRQLMQLDYAGAAITDAARVKAEAAMLELEAALREPWSDAGRLERIAGLDQRALLKPKRVAATRKRKFPDAMKPTTRSVLDRLGALAAHRALSGAFERGVVDGLLPTLKTRLERHKRRSGLLDYDDLLARLARAITDEHNGPRLVQLMRARFRFAFIDEFQDTDERQWSIFERVFAAEPEPEEAPEQSDMFATNAAPKNILCVIGDPKQAIYSFRGADVHTYLGAKETLLERGAARIPLRTNYRSTQVLIDAVNTVLDQSAKHALFSGAIRYDEPVDCGEPEALGPSQPLRLWRYEPAPPGPRSRMELPWWELERAFSKHMAREIRALIEAGDFEAREILVLVRTGREGGEVGKALRALGVPFAHYRQQGLFQTAEARHTKSMLAAIAEPYDRSKQMAALATPFFAIAWDEMAEWRHATAADALDRLRAWRHLGEHARFAQLFDALMHESGLVSRELLCADSERELTNYQHIFEILLELANRRRLGLRELIEAFDRYIQGEESPEGVEGNVQRLPSEQHAVQIMTIHKAKGLEAPVVCLFGGFRKGPPSDVAVIHDGSERLVLVGKEARQAAREQVAREQGEENQRLLYVALTRAKSLLMLPYIDSSRMIPGSYRPLNDRLAGLVAEGIGPGMSLETIQDLPRSELRRPTAQGLSAWTPPPPPGGLRAADFEALRKAHAPLFVTSYTRLKLSDEGPSSPLVADEFKLDDSVAGLVGETSLPGSREVGRFLHASIEELPFETLSEADFDTWAALEPVQGVFERTMRRYDIEPRWRGVAQRLVHDTLRAELVLGERQLPPLHTCDHQVELEFLFPLPEADHALLHRVQEVGAGQGFAVRRGYVQGYVDFVFRDRGLTYFADWKSDVLPDYGQATLRPHVATHYGLQAKLYALGVVRLLGLETAEDYAQRFGGLLYVFLRGMPEGGVYFERPAWEDILRYEQELLP